MLANIAGNRVQGDANYLPFAADSFDGVAALYMLYHIDKPEIVLAECRRVLRAGGLFVASAPSRFNDPELAEVLKYGNPETFDAENCEALVGEFFSILEVQRWDAALVHLPDEAALRLYLAGRGVAEPDIDKALETISTPLHLTKRGALIFAQK